MSTPPGDDALLDQAAALPQLAPTGRTAVTSDPLLGDTVDTSQLLPALVRGYRQVRDLLATARQAIQSIRTKDQAQDTAIAQLQADVAAIKTKVGL